MTKQRTTNPSRPTPSKIAIRELPRQNVLSLISRPPSVPHAKMTWNCSTTSGSPSAIPDALRRRSTQLTCRGRRSRHPRATGSPLDEGQQVRVYDVGVSRAHAVG
jgi:hypothetical protein